MLKQNIAHILVADDVEVNQQVAQLILRKAGYHVDVVENGRQAVKSCQQNHYDLVLMDIKMPLMDGFEATNRIRNAESEIKQVPIIAMSGNVAAGDFNEKQYPRINDCIGKPLQRDLLLSKVQKWISAESDFHSDNNPIDDAAIEIGIAGANRLPLDLDRALDEFMGEKDILIGVLQEFVKNATVQIDTIRRAAGTAGYEVMASEAHAIRGGAANLTADALAHIASDLENAAEARQPNLTFELADKLEQEFNCLKQYIERSCTK